MHVLFSVLNIIRLFGHYKQSLVVKLNKGLLSGHFSHLLLTNKGEPNGHFSQAFVYE